MRLSDEDDNLAAHEESNSISHQRKLMLDHIQKLPELKDCNIMEFSDDGYSGADFSRPNFVKMMDLVKAGKIQVIVTKDYSRLGRDYLEVGNYMECIFPVLQVRYISVNDNYDSANSFGSTGGMSVALKNLVNALYCKDASKKVRAAKAVLAKQGKYIAAFAPFGYQKSEDDKHMLVPDPVTAPVVQLIFELAIKGMKYTEIANYLNNNGYDSIFEYYQKIGVKRCYERDIGEHMWSASTVMEILYNEVYIGSVINNKTADNIDTGHQVVQRDKEDWIIVENCHEPLVSVEDFKLAHKMIARREVTKRKPNGKWRKSYIRCGICGKGLYKYGNKSSYRCHNGHVSRIRGEELEATLLDIARNMALAQLQEFELKTDGGNCPDNLEREIESLKKSKAHYAKLKFEIYDDYTKLKIKINEKINEKLSQRELLSLEKAIDEYDIINSEIEGYLNISSANNLGELKDEINKYQEASKGLDILEIELKNLKSGLEKTKEQMEIRERKIRVKLGSIGFENIKLLEVEDILKELEEKLELRDEINRDLASVEEAYSALTKGKNIDLIKKDLSDVINIDFKYSYKNEEEIDSVIKDKNLRLLEVEKSIKDIENEIKNRFNGKRTIPDIEEEIKKIEDETREKVKELKASSIAMESLQEAYQEIRDNFGPILNKGVIDSFGRFTDGKYNDVMVADNYEMKVRNENNIMKADILSNGANDQLNLSLRLAFIDMIFKSKDVSIYLDDAFVQYDNKRLEKTMKYLVNQNFKQCIIFTCQNREESILSKNNIEHKYIKLIS